MGRSTRVWHAVKTACSKHPLGPESPTLLHTVEATSPLSEAECNHDWGKPPRVLFVPVPRSEVPFASCIAGALARR